MRWLLLAFALGQLVLGLLLWLTPGFFHESIGPYGARNDHYMADVATWYLALGAVALVALRRVVADPRARPRLRAVGEAEPGWLGPANLVSLVLTTILLGVMLRSGRPAGAA